MSEPRNRQRKRTDETTFVGPNGSITTRTVEHSVFFEAGDIGSTRMIEMPIALGKLPHDFTEITAQCQSCFEFATDDMVTVCQACKRITCVVCSRVSEGITVCPKCAKHIERRRKFLILRKLFLDPFVERKG